MQVYNSLFNATHVIPVVDFSLALTSHLLFLLRFNHLGLHNYGNHGLKLGISRTHPPGNRIDLLILELDITIKINVWE